MDYIVGAISLISLGLNYWIFRRVSASYPVGTVEELEPIQYHCCCEAVIEHLNQEPQETEVNVEPPKPKVNSESYSAWVNRSGIPMVPQVKPPEPIVQPPNRGPLARPDGFV